MRLTERARVNVACLYRRGTPNLYPETSNEIPLRCSEYDAIRETCSSLSCEIFVKGSVCGTSTHLGRRSIHEIQDSACFQQQIASSSRLRFFALPRTSVEGVKYKDRYRDEARKR